MKKSAFILLRFIAAGIPFLFAVLVPYFVSANTTSDLFYNLSRIAILSSFLKLGMDSYILRRKDLAMNTHAVTFFFLVQGGLIGLLLVVLKIQFYEVLSALMFSILTVWGALELSLGYRLKSIVPVQFLFYPVLFVLLFYDIGVDAVIAALVISLVLYVPILTKKTSVIDLPLLENFVNREYFYLGLYSIISLIITNAPTVLSKNYLDDSLTIQIFQMVKFIGISSLISNIYIFLYNSDMQKGILKIKTTDRIVIIFAGFIFVIFYSIFFTKLSVSTMFGLMITISLLSFGNITGYFLVHQQTANHLLFSILTSSFIFLLIIAVFGVTNLLWAYYGALIAEAVVKIYMSAVAKYRLCRLP